MKPALKVFVIFTAALVAATAYLMSGSQLATAINFVLPKEWRVHIPTGLSLDVQGSALSEFRLDYQNCPLISANKMALTWVAENHFSVDELSIDYQCLSLFPETENEGSHFSLNALLALLPDGKATIQALNWLNLPSDLSPRVNTLLSHPARIEISSLNNEISAMLQQQVVEFSLHFAKGELNAQTYYQPSEKEEHKLSIRAKVDDSLKHLPQDLLAEYHWQLPDEVVSNTDLQTGYSKLNWQQNAAEQFEGNWHLHLADSENDKFDFPFLFDGGSLTIQQGRFDSNLIEGFPLHGFLTLKLTPNDLAKGRFLPLKTAVRISLLSENDKGKGNIVISNTEGEITEKSLKLPLRLTGNIKQGNFILYSSIPLDIQGNYDDVTLKFLPTSLLRLTGKERYLTIEDLRFPLAGIKVDKYGIHGRLQAIFKGESPDFENIDFRLDGYARNFKAGALNFFEDTNEVDAIKDSWNWRIWGNSTLRAFNSKVNLSGRGLWHKNLVQLAELKGNLAEVRLDSTTIAKTELILKEKIEFDTKQATLKGGLGLKSSEIKFAYGGLLPKPQAQLSFNGDIENLNFQGLINTEELGPLKLFARRQLTKESSQIVGKLYWLEQSARGFQPLFPFRSQWIIKNGTIRGETAFSANSKNGLVAGGHLAIKNAGLSLPGGEVEGIEFALPYRYQDGYFHFGAKKPIDMRIKQIKLGDLVLNDASMKINGYYPYSHAKPLNLNQLSIGLFGGRLNVKRFALPQTELAYLNLERLDFEKILQFAQYQQIDLKGKANAILPFWLSGKPCYICDGLLTQAENSYLAFTPELLAEMKKNGGYTEQILLHLVNQSEINDFRSLINMGSKGDMVLDSKLKLSSNQGQTKVNLNYNHRENMFDLWALINYGSQFEQKLENYLYQKLEK